MLLASWVFALGAGYYVDALQPRLIREQWGF